MVFCENWSYQIEKKLQIFIFGKRQNVEPPKAEPPFLTLLQHGIKMCSTTSAGKTRILVPV